MRMALVRTDVSEERSATIIRVTRMGQLGTTLALTTNRRTLPRNTIIYRAEKELQRELGKLIFQAILVQETATGFRQHGRSSSSASVASHDNIFISSQPASVASYG
jgi:hypothetical protein